MIHYVTSKQNRYIKLVHELLNNKRSDYFIIISRKLIIESQPFYNPTILFSTSEEILTSLVNIPTKIHISKQLFSEFKIGIREFPTVAIYHFEQLRATNYLLLARQKITLILDQIQNPGNLGAILRTAYAFGIANIILTHGSCYHYSFKVIEAARVPCILYFKFRVLKPNELFGFLKKFNYTTIATVPNSVQWQLPIWKSSFTLAHKNIALVLGSEGTGITTSLIEHCCDYSISINFLNPIHSLNVAVAFGLVLDKLGLNKDTKQLSDSDGL